MGRRRGTSPPIIRVICLFRTPDIPGVITCTLCNASRLGGIQCKIPRSAQPTDTHLVPLALQQAPLSQLLARRTPLPSKLLDLFIIRPDPKESRLIRDPLLLSLLKVVALRISITSFRPRALSGDAKQDSHHSEVDSQTHSRYLSRIPAVSHCTWPPHPHPYA